MEEININQVLHNIYIGTGQQAVTFLDPQKGLSYTYELLEIKIQPRNRHISTIWQERVYSNNELIRSSNLQPVITPEDHYLQFEAEIAGQIVKKSAVNGLYRYLFGTTYAIYNSQTLELILDQPVPWPQPVEEP